MQNLQISSQAGSYSCILRSRREANQVRSHAGINDKANWTFTDGPSAMHLLCTGKLKKRNGARKCTHAEQCVRARVSLCLYARMPPLWLHLWRTEMKCGVHANCLKIVKATALHGKQGHFAVRAEHVTPWKPGSYISSNSSIVVLQLLALLLLPWGGTYGCRARHLQPLRKAARALLGAQCTALCSVTPPPLQGLCRPGLCPRTTPVSTRALRWSWLCRYSASLFGQFCGLQNLVCGR